MNYRFIALASLILTVLVAADGLFMVITNYKPDDTSNNTLHMSDGTTVLIAAGILLIVTIVAVVLAQRPQVNLDLAASTGAVTDQNNETGSEGQG